jgi:hypothetical protein
MTQTKDVWTILSGIRDEVNGNLPSEGFLKVGAYFVGQKREKAGIAASSRDDWLDNLLAVQTEREHGEISMVVRDAMRWNEQWIALKLTVIRHLATFLRMRPTDIRYSTPINLEHRETNLIVSAVNQDTGLDFSGSWEPTVGDFLHLFEMQYELTVEREKREAAKTRQTS